MGTGPWRKLPRLRWHAFWVIFAISTFERLPSKRPGYEVGMVHQIVANPFTYPLPWHRPTHGPKSSPVFAYLRRGRLRPRSSLRLRQSCSFVPAHHYRRLPKRQRAYRDRQSHRWSRRAAQLGVQGNERLSGNLGHRDCRDLIRLLAAIRTTPPPKAPAARSQPLPS